MWKTLKSVVRPQGRYKLVTSVMSKLTNRPFRKEEKVCSFFLRQDSHDASQWEMRKMNLVSDMKKNVRNYELLDTKCSGHCKFQVKWYNHFCAIIDTPGPARGIWSQRQLTPLMLPSPVNVWFCIRILCDKEKSPEEPGERISCLFRQPNNNWK